MDAKLILILVGGVAFVAALLVVLTRARGRGGQMLQRSTVTTTTTLTDRSTGNSTGSSTDGSSFGDGAVAHKHVNVKFNEELFEMLSSGRREEVVRLVRERVGISEVEAEAVVARIETLMGRSER